MAVNKVILLGNVGQDPEVRYVEKDTPVANFSLATTERYTTRDGVKAENTEWHRIVAWRGIAKVVDQYVKKGSKLYIEGKLRSRDWTDKEGNKRYATEIFADHLELLDARPASAPEPPAPLVNPTPDLSLDANDNLPF